MKVRWLVVAAAALSVIAADAASAKPRKAKMAKPPACVDQPATFSWDFLLPGTRNPQPNGCAPPVHQYGRFIGQDPDLNIRAYMRRDPATGYSGEFSR